MNVNDNPSLISAVHNLVAAVIGMLGLFGIIDWTTAQIGGVLVVVSALGVVSAFVVRAKSTPNTKVSDLTQTAAALGRAGALDAVRALAAAPQVANPSPPPPSP